MNPCAAVLIVDDEALARSRLRTLLGDCAEPGAPRSWPRPRDGDEALQLAAPHGTSTWCCSTSTCRASTASSWRAACASAPGAPAVVFVTAHAAHAVTAFELEAVDYLTKPVRASACSRRCRRPSAT